MTGGIVCEYNPFHNGHLYHIEKTRNAAADFIVCVMSGNFVQRGECAIIDKWQRARLAVQCGADIVLDLPTPWAMSSAENFARGSIGMLSSFGIDVLSFGSETEDEELLRLCADASENEEVVSLLKKYMSQGMNYPAALSEGVKQVFGEKASSIISSPNSTLACEYIRQLKKLSAGCSILPVKRVGTDHDSNAVAQSFASASRIRSTLNEDASSFVPSFVAAAITENMKKGTIHSMKQAERAILSSLREMKKEDYSLYVTDESGLAFRIYETVRGASTLEELYDKAKSRNYTHARVRREVLNLYLKIPKDFGAKAPPYIKILAVNERGLSLLSRAKKNSALPFITKHSDAEKLSDFGKRVYELQCTAADKFALMCQNPEPCGTEQKNSMIIIK